MMDFCLGRLIHVSDIEIGRIMTETARGLDFLHRNNIIHGRLRLDHILLWRKRPDLKPIVKLSGYYPSSHQEQVINDISQSSSFLIGNGREFVLNIVFMCI